MLPTFNAERFVANAIESVLEQTSSAETELIVVDDGSSDATQSVVQSYGDRVQLIVQRNRGTAAARNAALRYARGKIVVLLDHDDELHPEFVDRVGTAFCESERIGFVFTNAYRYDDARKRFRLLTLHDELRPPAKLGLANMLRTNYVSARAAIRRSAVDQTGGFDEELSGVDDYDLWLRLLAAGYRGVALEEPLVFYRLRVESQSANSVRMIELHERALVKAASTFDLEPSDALELAIAVGAARERAHLLRGRQGLASGEWREASREFAGAWRISPLRWRGARLAAAIAGAVALRRAPAATEVGRLSPIRVLPPGSHRRVQRSVVRAFLSLRRRFGWNANPRRDVTSSRNMSSI